MALETGHKLKILYLLDILRTYTDEEVGISMPEIIKLLGAENINAERKSIYRDVESLRDYGVEIYLDPSTHKYHYICSDRGPDFELVELKLLVDAVQSSKFISARKSRSLLEKLKMLTSAHRAKELDRGIVLLDRVKNENKGSMNYLDTIHNSINSNHPITFKYEEWTPEGNKRYRHNSQLYKVSPWALVWNESNYYLVAYDAEYSILKHFRVDKMTNVKCIEGEKRQGEKEFRKVKPSDYNRRFFSMYHGDDVKVTLRCENGLANVIYDRFGKDIFKRKIDGDETHFEVTVDVNESPMFYGWLAGFGSGIEVTAPESTVKAYKAHIAKIAKLYRGK